VLQETRLRPGFLFRQLLEPLCRTLGFGLWALGFGEGPELLREQNRNHAATEVSSEPPGQQGGASVRRMDAAEKPPGMGSRRLAEPCCPGGVITETFSIEVFSRSDLQWPCKTQINRSPTRNNFIELVPPRELYTSPLVMITQYPN